MFMVNHVYIIQSGLHSKTLSQNRDQSNLIKPRGVGEQFRGLENGSVDISR